MSHEKENCCYQRRLPALFSLLGFLVSDFSSQEVLDPLKLAPILTNLFLKIDSCA